MPMLAPDDEPFYCHQQIKIPPDFPDVLKQFTKAAIRTQPRDSLQWAADYFAAMAKGEMPPVKERLDMPIATQKTDTGLTPLILKSLHSQLGSKRIVTLSLIEEKWRSCQLPIETFQELQKIGSFHGEIPWLHFLAVAASFMAGDLTSTLKVCCEVLTHDKEGGPARIPFSLFMELYQFLADLEGTVSESQITEVRNYLAYQVEKQNGFAMPRMFINPHCPPLA